MMMQWIGANVSRLVMVFAAMMVIIVTGCENDDDEDYGMLDVGSNNVNVVVCLGDSITAAEGLVPYAGTLGGQIGKTAINGGRGGDRAAAGASRVGGLLRSHTPGYLTILLGSNDAIHGGSTESVTSALTSIIGAARANSTIPILATIPPMTNSHAIFAGSAGRINEGIRTLASEQNVRLVDLEAVFDTDPQTYLDAGGLHPTQAGQDLIATAFAEVF